MSEVVGTRPPAPLVTRVMQALGAVGIALSAWVAIDARDCEGLECLASVLALYLGVWGLVAVLSGIRGPVGLTFLVGALVLALGVTWAEPFYGIIGLLVLSVLVSASKERLAPYYRRRRRGEAV